MTDKARALHGKLS